MQRKFAPLPLSTLNVPVAPTSRRWRLVKVAPSVRRTVPFVTAMPPPADETAFAKVNT